MKRYKTGEVLGEVRPNPENYKLPYGDNEKEIVSPITDQTDVILIQVPNLRESTYYAGMAALKAWMKKYKSDITLFCMDPITGYFDKHHDLIHSEFGQAFNTFSTQGNYFQYSKYKEMKDICDLVYTRIEKRAPKYVGFSIIDGNIDVTLYLAHHIKKMLPNVEILLGGKGTDILLSGIMSARYDNGAVRYDFTNWNFIDYIVYGDGEKPLEEIIEAGKDIDKLKKIKGLNFRLDGEWHGWNSETEPVNPSDKYSHLDFSKMPIPDYSDFEGTIQYDRTMGTTVPLTFSRGCPFKCSFCSIPTVVENFNYRDIDDQSGCIAEMEQWYNRGQDEFFIQDSIVNFRPDWLERFCKTLIEKDMKVWWGGNMRLMKPMRDFETMKLYSDAGFWQMITGLESASPKVLRHMKKYSSIQGTREIFENIREINKTAERPIRILLQLIIGYINETEEDFQMTMDFVEEFSDVIFEVTTCSLFLCWQPLVDRWEREGHWITFTNEVEWETEFSTLEERLERGKKIEKLFKKLGLKYNIYLREQISSNTDSRQRREEVDDSFQLDDDQVKNIIESREEFGTEYKAK